MTVPRRAAGHAKAATALKPAQSHALLGLLAALGLTVTLGGGCGDDKFDLVATTSSSATLSSGSGGAGGAGGAANSSSGSAGGGSGGAGGGFVEPKGATTLTLVNGVVDYSTVRFCWLPYPAGATDQQPWPDVEGLGFARAAVETDISQIIAPSSDIELVGFAGNITATQNANCAQILAAPPAGVEVWSFGILPASAFEQDRDLLVVTSGCMGGPTHSDVLQSLVCGTGYSVQTPTATVVAGFMSRLTEPTKVSMQFVQASRALQPTQLRVRPGQSAAAAQLVASSWGWGAIAPYPPYTALSLQSLGMVGNSRIELMLANSPNPVADVPFAAAFINSELTVEDVDDNLGFAFVAVGPSPGIASANWWNGFKITVVAANPG